MSTTGGDIIDKVLSRLEEETDSPVFWSRAELLVHVNDGYLELVLIGGQLTSERTLTLPVSNFHVVPDGAIAIMHVSLSDINLSKETIESIDRDNPNWQADLKSPKRWAPIGLTRWFVNPRPASSTAVKVVTLDEPAAIEEATVIDLDAEYIEAIEEYVFSATRFKEGGKEFVDSLPAYDEFLETAGMVEQRTYSEEFELWSKQPAADTGLSYSTMERS